MIQDKLLNDQYFNSIIFAKEQIIFFNCLAGSDILKTFFYLTASNIPIMI